MWERDVRILREALAPFYQNEKEMLRKLHEIEDKFASSYDEQVRLRDRVTALDDSAMSLEKRLEEVEGARGKRRRLGHAQVQEGATQNGHGASDAMRRVSSSVDERSVHTPSSRALSPNGFASALPEVDEPRSSGILNLADLPRPTTLNASQHRSPAQEEPRSSGLLNLDLAERHGQKAVADHVHVGLHHIARATPPRNHTSPPSYANSDPGVPRTSHTPPKVENSKEPVINLMVLPVNGPPRKRKHQLDHIALDVLADVTVASPFIH